MTSAEDLVLRILSVVPARSHALGALLQLFRIEASDAVATAAVSCQRRPVLRINPKFVARHCATDAHLFMLVMHELHHVLLGHTRLFPRATPAHNVVFDAVINALLCVRFPEEAYTSFFTALYGEEHGPLRLLAPPGPRDASSPALRALHAALYDGSATADEVFHALAQEAGTADTSTLLGSHGADEDAWGTDSPADPAVVDAIRAMVEKWPPPELPVRGRSLADVLHTRTVDITTLVDREILAVTRRALLGAAVQGRRTVRYTPSAIPALLPLPHPRDRRAAVALSLGATPLLYRSSVTHRGGHDSVTTHVYLDVSPSMNPWIADLYAALTALRRHLAPQVALFSTRVETVPLAALASGHRSTTGGTDFACVVDHALAHRYRRLLVVTDGYVGRVDQSRGDALVRAGVEVRVLLAPGGWRRDLETIASRIEDLPDTHRRTA